MLPFRATYITPATRFTRGHNQKFFLPQPGIDIYNFNIFSQIQLDYGTIYPSKQYMHTQSTTSVNYLTLL